MCGLFSQRARTFQRLQSDASRKATPKIVWAAACASLHLHILGPKSRQIDFLTYQSNLISQCDTKNEAKLVTACLTLLVTRQGPFPNSFIAISQHSTSQQPRIDSPPGKLAVGNSAQGKSDPAGRASAGRSWADRSSQRGISEVQKFRWNLGCGQGCGKQGQDSKTLIQAGKKARKQEDLNLTFPRHD